MSQHIGDLENAETLRSFTEGIAHFRRLFDVEPEVVAHDLHPEYLSTKFALELADEEGLEALGVQHHHAHIASCLADNGETGPVIGVAFDGTGFGPDGTIWGGEFLVADLAEFSRGGHLAPVPMPGGAAAIRQPWRMAAAYLDAAGTAAGGRAASGRAASGRAASGRAASGRAASGRAASGPRAPFGVGAPKGVRDHERGGDGGAGLDVARRNERQWAAVVSMARAAVAGRGVNAPLTSSAGRLFDAAAAGVLRRSSRPASTTP